ncbi:rod shape determining protein RodA [Clostridiales Family XIII bacterium PM5-7]
MNNFSNIAKNIDKTIIVLVTLLAAISILMIGSTQINTGFMSREVIVQIIAYGIGAVLAIVVVAFNYTQFLGLERHLYILSLLLLFSVYIPGLGVENFGSRAWIDLKITTIQPSEFVKILFILIMAGYLNEHKEDLYNFKGLIKAGLVAAPIILIVLKEDLGSALVFAAIWVVMIFFAGINLGVFAKFFALVVAAIPVAYVFMAPYQKERIEAFLHPNNLDLTGNYQVWQSKVAIGSGGAFGKGLFNGTQKQLDFIPVQTSDFIFSVIGEELGFVGGLVVIGILAILLIRFAKLVRNSVDLYGALIVTGIIGMLAFQIFENIAMTMGLMPVTGITLPFLSAGGSSIMSNMIAVGLVLCVGVRSKTIRF